MNKLILFRTLLFIMLAPLYLKGQQNVGIGTIAPNANAMLEVSSTNKGLLIPRIALTNTTSASPLGGLVAGMVIYNTASAGDVTPGYYGCDGTKWVRLVTGNVWSLTGNGSTSPATHFIGTTDDQDFVMKRNNARAGLLGTTNTSFGANALNPSTTAFHNTAFGSGALQNVAAGNGNTANGSGALAFNIAGLENTAVGFNALVTNNSGHLNTASGSGAMYSNFMGNNNTAFGSSALRNNQTGNYNTALGSVAGYYAQGSNNIFIGYNAGYNELGSNKLYIESSDADSLNALIFGNFGSNKLRFNGKTEGVYDVMNNDDPAIYGENDNSDFYGIGVLGRGGWKGVEGVVSQTGTSDYYGVSGQSFGINSGANYGVYGFAIGGGSNFGVYGSASGSTSYAGYFEGDVAIGDNFPKKATGYRLSVDGKVAAEEVLVDLNGDWPDYVFHHDYNLKSLDEVKSHIQEKGHLPNVPSAKEIQDNGILLGNMNKVLLEKIEELTLYILQQEEKLKNYELRLTKLEKGKQ